jgi:hypothetical protein
MKDMQGYIVVSNNCPTIIIIINCNITDDLWFLCYPWMLLTLIGMYTKTIIMKPHSSRWHVREDWRLQRFLGHSRKVSGGDAVCIPWKQTCSHDIEVTRTWWMITPFFYFIMFFWWMIDLDWHVHQKDIHETAQLSMTCQRGWKPT